MRKVGGNLREGLSIGVSGQQVVKVGAICVRRYTKKVKEEGTRTDLFSHLAVVAAPQSKL